MTILQLTWKNCKNIFFWHCVTDSYLYLRFDFFEIKISSTYALICVQLYWNYKLKYHVSIGWEKFENLTRITCEQVCPQICPMEMGLATKQTCQWEMTAWLHLEFEHRKKYIQQHQYLTNRAKSSYSFVLTLGIPIKFSRLFRHQTVSAKINHWNEKKIISWHRFGIKLKFK